MTLKHCTICQEQKDESLFYHNKSECMACSKERNAKYRAKYRAKQEKHPYPVTINGDKKVCNGCQKWQDLSMYSPVKTGQGGLQSKCKTCINATYRAKYEAIKKAREDKLKGTRKLENHWSF